MGLRLIEPMMPPALYANRGLGIANLNTEDPREVWVDAGSGNASLLVDFGADREWDTIVLVNCNGLASATWYIDAGTAAYGMAGQTVILNGPPLRAPAEDVLEPAGPSAFVRTAPISGRYIRVVVEQGSGGPALSVGRMIVGKSWQPSIGALIGQSHEYGAGRPAQDSGTRTRLESGGLARNHGALVSGFQWVFGDLAAADLKALWGMMRRLRTTMPLVLIEDSAAITDQSVHYGTFVDIERYERQDADKSRWALKFEDWM